jgi:hypothetical protein
VKIQKYLREFIALMNSHAVDYVVVGGHAVAYHGYPRFTGDLDFFVRASAGNAARLIPALHDFGFAGAPSLNRLSPSLVRSCSWAVLLIELTS